MCGCVRLSQIQSLMCVRVCMLTHAYVLYACTVRMVSMHSVCTEPCNTS